MVEQVKQLKNEDGGDLFVYGGAGFVSDLIKHDLIDEYNLFINPVAIGAGKPIFTRLQDRRVMVLVQSKAFDCGVVVMKYIPKRG